MILLTSIMMTPNTTMMLNTDTHSSAVASKTWDAKKFVGAGKARARKGCATNPSTPHHFSQCK